MKSDYQIVIIGGGHAGIEAAFVCARRGFKTVLVTLNLEKIGFMPCNPSIGGPAKGIVVRELAALGGQMPFLADKTALQVKMLNQSKGPGVWGLRTQNDKNKYSRLAQKIVSEQENLEVVEASVEELKVVNGFVRGVICKGGITINADCVIVTSGTYMHAEVLRGKNRVSSGPDNEPTSTSLSKCFQNLGFTMIRLKTGTPPRILKDSIDFGLTSEEKGTTSSYSFLYQNNDIVPTKKQISCFLTYTNKLTHQIIHENLLKSAAFSQKISKGPRYCPSIEDKIFRFPERNRHQLFLEPETATGNSIYIQGLSTSFSADMQDKILRSIPALKNARVLKWGYAIEYDAVNPCELKNNLESKKVSGLFLAGQINGTSGYEEAAGQGFVAGINATLYLLKKEPFVLKREESYIGVMISDLIRNGISEPYRLLTSRAEHRLSLRHDNAENRLIEKGRNFGLIGDDVYFKYKNSENKVQKAIEKINKIIIKPKTQESMAVLGNESLHLKQAIPLSKILRRPDVCAKKISDVFDLKLNFFENFRLEVETKFAGYIKRQKQIIKNLNKRYSQKLSKINNYKLIPHLSREAQESLNKVLPKTIGEAVNLGGVNHNDLIILSMYVSRQGQS